MRGVFFGVGVWCVVTGWDMIIVRRNARSNVGGDLFCGCVSRSGQESTEICVCNHDVQAHPNV